ncbi:antibiotic resistance protein VanZ [Mesotoga sp.]|uniref:antibiotic resistance protein VanZ n=1 Tax=Mesotoga sp. TaxID=2053577 RepID=UPI00345E3F05
MSLTFMFVTSIILVMKKIITAILSITYMIATVYFYLRPGVQTFVVGSDKFLHFVGFFSGGVLLILISRIGASRLNRLALGFFLVIGPLVLESLQIISPYRQFDTLDILFNYLGWIVPATVFSIVERCMFLLKNRGSHG